jgi:hypothetical protein
VAESLGPHSKDRLAEIAKVMRRYPWMVEVVKKKAGV